MQRTAIFAVPQRRGERPEAGRHGLRRDHKADHSGPRLRPPDERRPLPDDRPNHVPADAARPDGEVPHHHDVRRGGAAGRRLADPHVGRKVVIRMDLKDFFPSITYAQVRRVFSSFGYSYGVASALASLCCLEGKLVQGAPSSPALSNLVALNIDRRITGLKKHLKSADQKFYYTRYADDLIFSFDEENMVGTLPLIRQIVREEGFVVNEDKLRIMRSGRQQQVAGVVVNQRLNVNAAECRRLRAVLHNIRNHGWDTEMQRWQSNMGTCVRNQVHFRQILEGRIAFVRSLNPEKGGMLLDGLKAIELT